MTGIATPQELHVEHDGVNVLVTIQGAGTLGLPPDVAHQLARMLVQAANEVDQGKPWRNGSKVRPF